MTIQGFPTTSPGRFVPQLAVCVRYTLVHVMRSKVVIWGASHAWKQLMIVYMTAHVRTHTHTHTPLCCFHSHENDSGQSHCGCVGMVGLNDSRNDRGCKGLVCRMTGGRTGIDQLRMDHVSASGGGQGWHSSVHVETTTLFSAKMSKVRCYVIALFCDSTSAHVCGALLQLLWCHSGD